MALSNSFDFSMTRDAIIKAAWRLALGNHDPTTPYPDDYTNISTNLNMLLKSWQNRGVGLWLMRKLYLLPAHETASYSLSSSGTNITTTLVETAIKTAGETGDLTITVDSITGISASSYIGIELDDGTRQWTTVSGSPSGYVVTLAAALTDDAAIDNTVKVYSAKAQRPLRIIDAVWRDYSGNDSGLEIINSADYLAISDKTETGTPLQVYYDPQLTTGVLYVWPAPETVDGIIVMTVSYPINDMDASADDIEIPAQWLRAVVYNLAVDIALEYPEQVSERVYRDLKETAKEEYEAASLEDREVSYTFTPDTGD
jgi:hypothetical protein